jgi:ketosteroid isomerase-like protein
MDKEAVLAAIDAAYAARIAGDKAALAAMSTPLAHLRIAGDHSLLTGYRGGPGAFADTAADLIDQVRFHAAERVDAVVEGHRAAVLWRATLSAGGGAPYATELYDLWELDETGKILSLVQFVDTARLREALEALQRQD